MGREVAMRRVMGVCLALILGLMAGCGGPAKPALPPDTVVIGKLVDIENWNPYLADSAFADDLLTLLYPTLAVEQPDFTQHPPSFEPWLASGWAFSGDGLSLTVHLDPRARWSDGVPVTSEDVLFTWTVRHAPEVGWYGAEDEQNVTGVEAVDDHTVVFHFARRDPYQLMEVNDGPIVPAHAWRSIPFDQWDRTDWAAHALSAGPFRLARHTPQQEIVLERNPEYWIPGRPAVERVVWRVVPDQNALLTQLLAGRLDCIEAVPPREAHRVEADPQLRLVTFPDRAYTFIGWNLRRPLFADRRVRRALTLAIDRDAILRSARAGYGRPGIGPVLSTMWAFDRSLAPLPHDPAAARKLLAEAGWRDSDGDGVLDRDGQRFAFELMTNAGNETRHDILVLVQADLARVGIEVRPRLLEWGAMNGLLQRGNFDAVLSAWRESTRIDLGPIWHSAAPGEPTYNWVGYRNPEVDRLLEAVEELSDFAEQKPLLDRIQKAIVADQPYTFLYESDRLVALSKRIGDADINSASPYFNLDRWTIEANPE